MARDFDFRPSQKVKPPNPVNYTKPSRQTTSRKTGRLPIILVVGGLLAIAAALYLQFSNEVSPATTNQTATQQQKTTTPDASSTIRVYDGGAGETASQNLVAQLKTAGYLAEYFGKTLDTYDQTEIWHIEGKNELAQKIVKDLSLTAAVHQSQIPTGYDILIFLGKR